MIRNFMSKSKWDSLLSMDVCNIFLDDIVRVIIHWEINYTVENYLVENGSKVWV